MYNCSPKDFTSNEKSMFLKLKIDFTDSTFFENHTVKIRLSALTVQFLPSPLSFLFYIL